MTGSSDSLDRRDLDILKFLAGREVRGEGPPSTREVAGAAGLKSPRSGYVRLGKLADEGYVEMGEGEGLKRRPVKLSRSSWEAIGEMPFAGRIAAGRGLEALAVGESYSLTTELLASGSHRSRYLLRVVGESMRDGGIHDGDLLVVEEDPSPEDGAIVVALLHGGEEVTVKRLRRENGNIRLRAQSDGYEDIVVAASEVEIQGRVVWTLHPS